MESDLMTANEVCEYLRIPQSTVYKLVQEGKFLALRSVVIGDFVKRFSKNGSNLKKTILL